MKAKVIVYSKVDSTVLDFLNKSCDVIYFEQNEELMKNPQFLDELRDANAILGSRLKVDSSFSRSSTEFKNRFKHFCRI